MSPSELLRKFADMLDAKYDGVAPDMSDPEASNVDYKPESGESESCGCEGDSGLSQQRLPMIELTNNLSLTFEPCQAFLPFPINYF